VVVDVVVVDIVVVVGISATPSQFSTSGQVNWFSSLSGQLDEWVFSHANISQSNR